MFLKKLWNKRGQLGWIEMQYFFFGFIAGLILTLVLILLMRQGIIPFKIPMLSCPVCK